LGQGLNGSAVEGLKTAEGAPENVSHGLTGIWGRFSVFHTHSSAAGVLCNVILAAYHLGCLFEVSSLLIDHLHDLILITRGMGIL
jgi:hypothetical protein